MFRLFTYHHGLCLTTRIIGLWYFVWPKQTFDHWRICFYLRSERRSSKLVPIRLRQRLSGILLGILMPFKVDRYANHRIHTRCALVFVFLPKGVWSWQYNAGGECSDTRETQDSGMNKLRGQNGAGGTVNFPVGF